MPNPSRHLPAAPVDRQAEAGIVRPHLSEQELADRWLLSARTLQRWRQAGTGPVFLRLGRRIVYRRSDVEHFEEAQAQTEGRA